MLNVFYLIVLMMYAISIVNPLSSVFVVVITTVFFVYSFLNLKKTSKNSITTIIQLMCLSIPLSWRTIFGGNYSESPITYFYIFGVILAFRLLLIKNNKIEKRNLKIIISVSLILIFNIILLINSHLFSDALSQFIILSFHHVLVLIALIKGNVLPPDQIGLIEKTYINTGYLTSLGVISQYILYQLGVRVGYIDFYLNRETFRFLFGDVSHLSLYLATCTFLSFLSLSKNKNRIFYLTSIVVTSLASAISSARTGLVVLALILLAYILFEQKGVIKKATSIVIFLIVGYFSFTLLQIVRPQGSTQQLLFDSSGRLSGYNAAFNLFLNNPFLGYGFGVNSLSSALRQPIPHLSFLQYLSQGGVLYVLLVFGVLFYSLYRSKKLFMNIFWLILITLIGTSLIPDIFSTRYITLLIVIVFLINPECSVNPSSIENNSKNTRTDPTL